MWWASTGIAAALPPLPRAAQTPTVQWYARIDEAGGTLTGRWKRRRDGEHALSELSDGLVVRWVQTTREAVLDHQRDAAGRPLATVRWEKGAPVSVTAHGLTDHTTDVTGWSWVAVPGGGAMWLPSGAVATADTLTADLLGGRLSVTLSGPTDPFTPAFAEGLLDGCGCTLFDRSTVWVDDQPGARHALLLPDPEQLPGEGVPALAEVWAVPRGERLLVVTWRLALAPDPVAGSLLARTVPALLDLDHAAGSP